MQVDLEGKVALITGAGRGIGKVIADTLAANHAVVVYTDIDGESARAAAGPDGFALRLDVSNPDEVEQGVAPGSILTEGTRQLFYADDGKFRDRVAALLAHIPLGRPGTPEEVAHAALFLAAPESSYINGHILTVDGGWTAGYTREF